MNQPDYPVEEFRFQLDEFYLDLQEDGSRISILEKEKIKQRPFPGLRPFKTSEFQLFKGRDGQAEELIKRLKENHFLAVIGSSGTGKSSLVRAGLIPQLFGGYLHEAGTRWNIAICRPGKNPVENLAVALSRVKDPGKNKDVLYNNFKLIYPTLGKSIFGVLEVDEILNSANPSSEKANLLIIVDQFEELFRFERDGLENQNIESYFVNLLLKASMNPEGSVYVIITMRSEFLGDCVKYRGLPEAINKGQYLVPQLSRQQLKEVIVGPVTLAEKKISPGLVELLINEIDENKLKENLDQLPILQHALMRTYQEAIAGNPDAEINNEHYKEIGGMDLALANHAENKYRELGAGKTGEQHPSKKQKIAKIIFQALTDATSDQKGGRRPIELKYLYAIAESLNANSEEVDAVIDHFRDPETSFIMPPANTALYPGLMMDISHESLMRNWSRLDQWIKEEVELGKLYKTLNDRRDFNEKKDANEFVRGILLEEEVHWRDQYPHNAIWASRYHDLPKNQNTDARHSEIYQKNLVFLEASALKHSQEITAREQQLREEMERAQKEKVRKKILRAFAGGAVISFCFAVWAFTESTRASQQKQLAVMRSDSLAVQTIKAKNSASEALQQKSIAADNLRQATEERAQVQILKDIAEKNAEQIAYQNRETKEQNKELQKHLVIDILKKRPFYSSTVLDSTTKENIIRKLFFDPLRNREEINIGQHIDTGMLLNVEAAVSATQHFQLHPVEGLRMAEKVWTTNKSEISKNIFSDFFSKNIFYSQQLKPSSYGIPSDYSPSAFFTMSGDGSQFAFTNYEQIFTGRSDNKRLSIEGVYNVSDIEETGEDAMEVDEAENEVMAFCIAGRDSILSFHRDGKLFEWNSKGNKMIGRPFLVTHNLRLSKFSPDGRFLITVSKDGAIRKWNVDALKKHEDPGIFRDSTALNKYVKKIVFSPDSKRMIKIFTNDRFQVWDLLSQSSSPVFFPGNFAQVANFSQDGQYVLAFDLEGRILIFNSSGQIINQIRFLMPGERNLNDLTGRIQDIVLSPDWKKLLVKHARGYVVCENRNANDPLIKIGTGISYKIDSNLRVRKLSAIPNPAAEAFFLDNDAIISIDAFGFISLWDLHDDLENIDHTFSDVKNLTAKTYREKDGDSPLLFDQMLESDNVDSLKSAAAYYYQKSRDVGKTEDAQNNLQKAKRIYRKLYTVDNSSFVKKSYLSSIISFNDELYELERLKGRNPAFVIECIKENVSILEDELRLHPRSSGLKKRLSDYYWPLSYYQLFVESENHSAVESALRGLELYKLNNGINTNLALGYLLTGQVRLADSIYMRFKDSLYSSRLRNPFRASFLGDFEALVKEGVISDKRPELKGEMDRIKKILEK